MLAQDSEIRRYYFDLNESNPVHVISHYHDDPNDSYFDMHYEVELGIVTKGRMQREYLNYQKEVGPGETWLCGIWEPHGFEIVESPCEVVIFFADPAHLTHANPFSFDLLRHFMIPPSQRPDVKETTEMVDLALDAKNRLSDNSQPDWAKLILYKIILMLNDHYDADGEDNFYYEDYKSIQPALRMVFEEKRLIKTEEAAQQCKLSTTGFRNKFRDLMGSSFSEFALQYRVRGAKTQLQHSNATQQTVAKEWGFTDASHLHKYLEKI